MEMMKATTSRMTHLTSKSDFDFDYDELVDNFDEFELSDEDVEEPNPMNESCHG